MSGRRARRGAGRAAPLPRPAPPRRGQERPEPAAAEAPRRRDRHGAPAAGAAPAARDLALLAAMVGLQSAWLLVRGSAVEAAAGTHQALLVAIGWLAAAAVAALPSRALERLAARLPPRRWSDREVSFVLFGTAFVAMATIAAAEPRFTWDEHLVLQSARAVARRGLAGLLEEYGGANRWLAPHHPPLAPLLFGGARRLFGRGLVPLRLVAVVFSSATVVLTWRIGLRLVARRTALLGALALLSCPLFVRIGGAAMNDGVLTAFFALAVLLAQRFVEAPGAGRAIALGLAIGVGSLVKYTILLALPVVAVVVLATSESRVAVRHALAIGAFAVLPLLVWGAIAARIGVLGAQQAWISRAAGVSMRGAFGQRYLIDALAAKLPSALGTYNLPVIALGVAAVLRRRAWQGMLLLAWVALVFVPLILTLPDNRYFLPAFPALALIAAIGIDLGAAPRLRPLLLGLALCAIAVVYYLQADVTVHASLFAVKP